ncbi:MAG: GNAT family N-acetyltransferase [bacterium]|nr:GNAT family N-acetyltransferase [bacterium]
MSESTLAPSVRVISTFEKDGIPYTIRTASAQDIPFLAWMQHEASLPPSDFSFWDGPMYDFGLDTRAFIETVLRLDAGTWGAVNNFFVLEREGEPVAAAAGIEASADFARGPVRISAIESIGQTLGWSAEQTDTFRQRYTEQWPDPQGNFLLLPQAPWIIESVALIPQARGRGLVKPLMNALLDEGRRRGHSSVGITVANGNAPAQHVYERMGFEMYLAFGPAFFGQPGFGGYTKYKMAL